MSTQVVLPRPQFGKLFGITYDKKTKAPLIRISKVMKVGIGISKGRAVHVFMHNGDWVIRFGTWEKTAGKDKLVMKAVYRGNSVIREAGVEMRLSNERRDVEAWYHAHKQEAAISNRPQKLPHFAFYRKSTVEEQGHIVEVFEPDFEAIEAHGDAPKRIPMCLTTDAPLQQEMAMYSATELKCHGDGIAAERAISMGSAKDAFWSEAKAAGDKMFVYGPCGEGCPYAFKECKPHTTLQLQLTNAWRLGSTAYFTSTGIVTASRLFSSLTEIADFLHRRNLSICGIPVDLVLNSFRANHDGKASAQPYVSLELRAPGRQALEQILAENAWIPARLSQELLAAPVMEEGVVYETEALPALIAEFSEPEFDDEPADVAPSQAAAATDVRTEELGKALANARKQPETATPAVISQWTDRQMMNAKMLAEKARIGDERFGEILSQHGTLMGTLSHTSEKAALVFADMVASPNAAEVF